MEISPFIGTLIGNTFVAIGIIIVVLLARFVTKRLKNYLDFLTAITVGLLLGIIFLGFLPELIESGIDAHKIGIFILFGIFIFYILELFLHWHHCKDFNPGELTNHKHEHDHSNLIFAGTVLHNTFHGIEIFAAFAINFNFGILVSVAILLHSIPQNVVNYVMNHNNLKIVLVGAFSGVFGALVTYPFGGILAQNRFYILAIIAGGLLYTSLADIFPAFKSKGNFKNKIIYLIFVIVGIISFLGFDKISGHEHEHNQKHIENLKNKN